MAPPSTGLSADQRRLLAARLRVGVSATVFREHLAACDLAGVWDGIDPDLRLAWARHWAHTRAVLSGMCPDRLATELASPEGPSQQSWRDFEQDQLQHLADVDHTEQRNPAPGPPLLPADIAVLYADPSHPGTWAHPSDPRAVPMLMRWNGTTWLVLTYGSAHPPTG
jgi:hypothetical protein